nr:MAG TPA: hypothetical protein [Caudoviricetes sp.]
MGFSIIFEHQKSHQRQLVGFYSSLTVTPKGDKRQVKGAGNTMKT